MNVTIYVPSGPALLLGFNFGLLLSWGTLVVTVGCRDFKLLNITQQFTGEITVTNQYNYKLLTITSKTEKNLFQY